jgi:hypothetical protein
MDDGKPSIPPHDLRSQSASERPSAAADPPPAALATSEERVSPEVFDDRELFVATDRRFPAPPGKVGLWTQADSMILFESLKIGSLD